MRVVLYDVTSTYFEGQVKATVAGHRCRESRGSRGSISVAITTSSVSVISSPILESLLPAQHGQHVGAG
jgi:hypothetical protein